MMDDGMLTWYDFTSARVKGSQEKLAESVSELHSAKPPVPVMPVDIKTKARVQELINSGRLKESDFPSELTDKNFEKAVGIALNDMILPWEKYHGDKAVADKVRPDKINLGYGLTYIPEKRDPKTGKYDENSKWRAVRLGDSITESEAKRLSEVWVRRIANNIKKNLRWSRTLMPETIASVLSSSYNISPYIWYSGKSPNTNRRMATAPLRLRDSIVREELMTLDKAKKIVNGEPVLVNGKPVMIRVPGLTNRRRSERQVADKNFVSGSKAVQWSDDVWSSLYDAYKRKAASDMASGSPAGLLKGAQSVDNDEAVLLPPGSYPFGDGDMEYSTTTQVVPDKALDWIESAEDPRWYEVAKKMYRGFSNDGKDLPVGKEGRKFLEDPAHSQRMKELVEKARNARSFAGLVDVINQESPVPLDTWPLKERFIPVTNALDYATRPFYRNGMPVDQQSIDEISARFAKGIQHITRKPKSEQVAVVGNNSSLDKM